MLQDALDGQQGTVSLSEVHGGTTGYAHRLSMAYNQISTRLFSFLLVRFSTCNFGLRLIDE